MKQIISLIVVKLHEMGLPEADSRVSEYLLSTVLSRSESRIVRMIERLSIEDVARACLESERQKHLDEAQKSVGRRNRQKRGFGGESEAVAPNEEQETAGTCRPAHSPMPLETT